MRFGPSALVVALVGAAPLPAHAQEARSVTPPPRVQVNYQLQLPFNRLDTLEEQKAEVATAHTALYDLVNRECAMLEAAFGSECRLSALNIGNFQQPAFPIATTISATANATFELTPSSPPKASKPNL